MILGLDISTSCTGITVIDKNGVVLLNTYWKFKQVSMFRKLEIVREEIKKIKKKYNIEKVCIEESLQSFRSGFSSAKTLSTLSKFNGTVSWLIYEILGIEPVYVSAATARKRCGIKIEKNKRAKECVMEHMLANEKWFQVEYKKTGKIKDHCYDMADSFVIAKSGFLS